jgi:CheY-like chemotaxis protein
MSARGKHVFVIEDDLDIRESVVEVLADEGFTVSAAGDGLQALAILRGALPKPDLILLDLMMPVMNGFQFREEQRKDPELAAIPVVVITADVNARAKAESLAAAGFIQKPVKIQPLLDMIYRQLER